MVGKDTDDEHTIELVFIEGHMDAEMSPVFKLAELVQLYKSRMKQLAVKHDGRVHTTCLKQRLLAHFPNMCAQHQRCDVLLGFNEDLGNTLVEACELNRDLDAVYLVPSMSCEC